jgi:hypothetical protein
MRTNALARGSALAGLAAASATAAHGGTAALSDPAWSLPALAAAAAGSAALLRLVSAAQSARSAAAHVPMGGRAPAQRRAPGLAETTAIMLAAQGCAHLALLAAGAPAHPGQAGALALHTALALLGATVIWAADRRLAAALDTLATALAAAIELLLGVAAAIAERPRPAPAARPHPGAHLGRAPPATA